MMKKVTVVLAILLSGVALLIARPVIKVGVITPMSGDTGAALAELAEVMQARVEQLNEDATHLFDYEFIFEDSQFSPKKSHLAAQKLISVDQVDVLVPVASLSAKVTQPLAERYGIAQLAVGNSELADGQWCFGYLLDEKAEIRHSLATAAALGVKRVVSIGERQEAMVGFNDQLEQVAPEYGIKFEKAFYYNPGDNKDYRAHLLKIRELDPDLIYVGALPPAVDILLRQAKQMGGFEGKISSLETLSFVSDPTLLGGIWLAGCKLYTPEILENFEKLGVLEPKLPYSIYVYDIPTIVVEAVEAAGQANDSQRPSRSQIRDALAGMESVQTILGEVSQTKGFFGAPSVLVYYNKEGVGREVGLEELKNIYSK